MRHFFSALLFFVSIALSAQSVAINTDGSTAHSSAILDVKSTTKGFLAPRMTTLQRNAIAYPTSGLLVYDTNLNTYFYRAGSAWQAVNVSIALADADNDTKIQVEETPNDNAIRFDVNGSERMVLLENASGTTRLELEDEHFNTFVGKSTGTANSTGFNNTAFGANNLSVNTSGHSNTALGFASLAANTTGNSNIGIGVDALSSNTTGYSNLGVGRSALASNISGSANLAIGNYTLTDCTTGNNNTGIGAHVLQHNITGYINTAVGNYALYENTTGISNVAIGNYALWKSTTATNNVAMGNHAMAENTTGSRNTGIGIKALEGNTTSSYNAAIGYFSGRLYQNGSNNTFIGAFADSNADGYSNGTAIGYQATISASNQIRVGNASVSSIGGYQNWTNISDARLKNDVKADVPGLEFIKHLRPVTYVLDRNKIRETLGQEADSETQEGRSTGFLAQEVAAAAQAARFEFSGVDMPKNEQDFYGLRYAEFTVPLVKAVQELDAENKALRSLIADLQARLEKLEASGK